MPRRCVSFCQKMVGPAAKREAVAHLQAELGLSERRACSIVSADRKMIRYRSCPPPDTELRVQLREPRDESGFVFQGLGTRNVSVARSPNVLKYFRIARPLSHRSLAYDISNAKPRVRQLTQVGFSD